jgi:hypothetical protein
MCLKNREKGPLSRLTSRIIIGVSSFHTSRPLLDFLMEFPGFFTYVILALSRAFLLFSGFFFLA